MIIATAGHVDHGKTALVRQLTGVDTDRLEEEKRRGLSISLGYAYLYRGEDTPLGFIDVPGHHRFINNMISGISAIDMGLLVIAADDGLMPQTREHLDVMRVMGVRKLAVAVSKIDRVEAVRLTEVKRDISTWLAEQQWPEVPLFPVSNTNAEGIDTLKDYLLECATSANADQTTGHFRLSIDRVFTVKGSGLVVTGTASAGTVSTGDTLILQPGNIEVRVRGLRVHDQEADSARAGQRCALNLTGGASATELSRGAWLVGPGAADPSRRLDVECTLLDSVPFALKHYAPVKFYIGATRLAARLVLLKGACSDKRFRAGERYLAQLILDEPVPAWCGQPFLLRDHSESVLLGGGIILDPAASINDKAQSQRIACLEAMCEANAERALARIVAKDILVNLEQFRQARNLTDDDELAVPKDSAQEFVIEGTRWLCSQSLWRSAAIAIDDFVERWHEAHPHDYGIKASELRKKLAGQYDLALLTTVMSAQIKQRELTLSDGYISKAGFSPRRREESELAWHRLERYLTSCGKQVPLRSELLSETAITEEDLQQLTREAVREGRLISISSRRLALPCQLLEFSQALLSLEAKGEPLSVIALKNRWGVGRNLAVEVLEYFDGISFTRREGDTRRVLNAELPEKLFSP